MFLGGSLDHATRRIRADEIRVDRPASDTYKVVRRPGTWMNGSTLRDPLEEIYTLRRCASGIDIWWVYVLNGHEPSRTALLDANPGPFYSN